MGSFLDLAGVSAYRNNNMDKASQRFTKQQQMNKTKVMQLSMLSCWGGGGGGRPGIGGAFDLS